jgi:hypothetical protein|tara:strand:- start:372 stop:857 length:486 start_codon:yes stop_codon:yes gene_type:complete
VVKYLIIFSLLFITACQKEVLLVEKYESFNKPIFINTVQKNLNLNAVSQGPYSDDFLILLTYWVDNNIKTNGFDGLLEINLVSIVSSQVSIENGVRFQIDLDLDFIISKSALDNKTLIKFKGNEFSEILGQFSLNDKNIEINNVMNKLIDRLSNKLFEEIN